MGDGGKTLAEASIARCEKINSPESGEKTGVVAGDVADRSLLRQRSDEPVKLANDLDNGSGARPKRGHHLGVGPVLAPEADAAHLTGCGDGLEQNIPARGLRGQRTDRQMQPSTSVRSACAMRP